MPRIDTNARRITTSPVTIDRRQQVSPDAFGAGLGDEVQRTAGVINGMQNRAHEEMLREKAKADRLKADDASLQVAAKRLELSNRMQQARGDQALAPDFIEGMERELQESITGARGGLLNPEQADAFDRDAQRSELGFREELNNHVLRQGEIVAKDKADGLVSTHMQSAVANRGDNGLAWQDLAAAQDVRMRYLKDRGVPFEAINAEMMNIRSNGVADIVVSLVDDGNYMAAEQWLEASGNQLVRPEDKARAERAVRVAKVDGESKRVALGVVSSLPSGTSTYDMEDALRKVEAATAGMPQEIRDEAQRRTWSMLNAKAAAHTESQNALEQQVLARTLDPQRPLGFDDPTVQQVWRQLDPVRAAKVRAELTRPTDADAVQSRLRLANYELLVADPSLRKQIIEAGPLDGATGMTKEDQRAAIGMWVKAKLAENGDATARRELEGLHSKNEAVANVLRSAGYSMRKKDGEGFDTKTAAALDWISREGKALQAGRPDRRELTADDWTVIARKAVAEQTIKGRGTFGGDTAGRTADMAMQQVAQIPGQHRQALEERFNTMNGRFPTATELLQAWEIYRQQNPEAKPLPTEQERRQRAADAARATMFFGPF